MDLFFLSSTGPLTKKFTATTKEAYPNILEFTSHQFTVNTLNSFFQLLQVHAAQGHCLLKGELTRQLTKESRAGCTIADAPTHWLCLDLDHIPSIVSVQAFMNLIGLQHLSYILQWSASYRVARPNEPNANPRAIKAHLFILLANPATPTSIKLWLKQINLNLLKPDLQLTRTQTALRWALDITTCQNDKLLFIAPPLCTPASLDTFTGPRITLVPGTDQYLDFSLLPVMTAEQLRILEEDQINTLRKAAGLPPRTKAAFKLKEFKGETYLPNPGLATVTGVKAEPQRGFVYLNLNGGDSWGYYHPIDNPTFIYNFKGEPTYKTSELIPEYIASLKTTKKLAVQAANAGKIFLAFRDFRTTEYYNGWYDTASTELILHRARSERQIEDFLTAHGQPVPDAIPIWHCTYAPQDPPLNLLTCTVNLFRPSSYMKQARALARLKTVPPAATPLIDRIMVNIVGAEMTPRLFNWLAYIWQHLIAPGTAWIWHGTTGTGKGVFIHHVLSHLFGSTNVSLKRMEELEDRFNAHLEDTLLCFVDEAQIADSGRSSMIMASLKNQITEPFITIRRMHTSAYEVVNHVGWIFASNKPDPVRVDSDDRRFNVGEYQEQSLQITSQEIKDLARELQNFADRLELHQIDYDAVRTPAHTEARSQMIMVSRNSADTVADALRQGYLQPLWDALPTVDISSMDLSLSMRLGPYKALLYDLITTGRTHITRDELFILFQYVVGSVPSSPWKLTSYLKHHGLSVKDIRIGTRIHKGIVTTWKDPSEWLEQVKTEIAAELSPPAPLTIVPTKKKRSV